MVTAIWEEKKRVRKLIHPQESLWWVAQHPPSSMGFCTNLLFLPLKRATGLDFKDQASDATMEGGGSQKWSRSQPCCQRAGSAETKEPPSFPQTAEQTSPPCPRPPAPAPAGLAASRPPLQPPGGRHEHEHEQRAGRGGRALPSCPPGSSLRRAGFEASSEAFRQRARLRVAISLVPKKLGAGFAGFLGWEQRFQSFLS